MEGYSIPAPTGDWSVATTVISSIWSMFAVTTIFFGLRVYCRASRKALWWDDYLLIAGWAFLLASTASITQVFRLGYTTTRFGGDDITPLNYAADDMHKLALGLSKTSFALTLIRFTSGWTRHLVIVVTVIMNVMLLTHSVLVWRGNCGIPSKFTFEPCWPASSGAYMNMVGSVISAVSDFLFALLPITVLYRLQMPKREKIGAAVAMSIGIVAGIVAIIKAVQSLTISDIFDPKFGNSLAVLSIWIEAEPNATIIAASIPVLRVLFRDAKDYMSSNSVGARYNLESQTQKGSRGLSSQIDHTKSNVKATITNQDHSSETSILSRQNTYQGGIKQTREVVVDYDDRNPYYGQGVELRAIAKKV